ncbi:hypothetical protein Pcinc_019700 [Petrolisthes cinctipes]|uniref:Uncharacterized protein n=1 Tax=Petrolisthes cinctipes TaxID=88211 RepID=A0AAE1FKR2_PETCI|nr:hypothetical protein Pcinc_019700 [Petrolisthes cinctipes]
MHPERLEAAKLEFEPRLDLAPASPPRPRLDLPHHHSHVSPPRPRPDLAPASTPTHPTRPTEPADRQEPAPPPDSFITLSGKTVRRPAKLLSLLHNADTHPHHTDQHTNIPYY